MSDKRIYFGNLDTLRFFSAMMIVFLHTMLAWTGWFGPIESLMSADKTEVSFIGKYVYCLFNNLGIGVDVFFLISGFLITYLLLEEKKQTGRIAGFKFILRRIFRIWPVFYLLIALGPFLVSYLESAPAPNYLMNALFLGNYDEILSNSFIYPFIHFWSICVEEHFYIFLPMIVAWVPRKRLLLVFGALIGVSILYRMFSFHYVSNYGMDVYVNTLSRMDVLLIGSIIGYYYSKKPFTFTLPTVLRIFLFVLLVFLLMIMDKNDTSTFFAVVFKKYLFIGLILILFLDYQFNKNGRKPFIVNPVFSYLGKCSYGIYMYSNIIVLFVVKKIMILYGINNMWLFFAFNFGLSLIVSIISYELMEKPLVKWSHRFRVIK